MKKKYFFALSRNLLCIMFLYWFCSLIHIWIDQLPMSKPKFNHWTFNSDTYLFCVIFYHQLNKKEFLSSLNSVVPSDISRLFMLRLKHRLSWWQTWGCKRFITLLLHCYPHRSISLWAIVEEWMLAGFVSPDSFQKACVIDTHILQSVVFLPDL